MENREQPGDEVAINNEEGSVMYTIVGEHE